MTPDRLKREIASVFEVIRDRSTDDELCVICPVPGCQDRTGNRHINVKTLYTNCWRCGSGQPHHARMLFKMVGLEIEDDHAEDAAELMERMKGKVKKALTPVQEVEIPGNFQLLSANRKSCYWRFCRDMAERKRLGIEDLEEAGAGFTREGAWEPYCIFPVYEGTRLVYYQGRTYTDEGFDTTKRFPSKKEVPYGPSYWVYNLDALTDPAVKIVVVVESILNVLSLRRRLRELGADREIVPVCTFTHRISDSQVAKLRRYKHVKELCILYDSDSSSLASETGMIVGTKMPVTIATMPHGKNPDGSVRLTNDANDDVDAALEAILDRRLPSDVDMLRAKLASRTAYRHGPLDVNT